MFSWSQNCRILTYKAAPSYLKLAIVLVLAV